jgi:hypothetical protein
MRRMIAASRRSQQGSLGEAASFRNVFSFAKSLAAAGQADRREPPGGAEQRCGTAAQSGDAEQRCGTAARNGGAERRRETAARYGGRELSALDTAPKHDPRSLSATGGRRGAVGPVSLGRCRRGNRCRAGGKPRARREISCADTASAACPSGDPRHPGSSPASWSRLRSSASRR